MEIQTEIMILPSSPVKDGTFETSLAGKKEARLAGKKLSCVCVLAREARSASRLILSPPPFALFIFLFSNYLPPAPEKGRNKHSAIAFARGEGKCITVKDDTETRRREKVCASISDSAGVFVHYVRYKGGLL